MDLGSMMANAGKLEVKKKKKENEKTSHHLGVSAKQEMK